jgi:hypothetical protein
MKLPLQTSAKNLHYVSESHMEMLSSTPDWEIVGAVVFDGRVDLLVFVERNTFFQVAVEVFQPSDVQIPARWRMATGVADHLPRVSLLIGHPLIVSDPDLVAALIDMDADAMAKLRTALEHDEA